ncbi:hypothetical protein CY35_18G078000 [Sphagnum magellanicum]|nr:hypothetical protein CY35_18G078000 [Sphagnum magellanicum]KAH9533920.1 hypothetical protein CY35_18G078000 [Sphagnum magellanicum]
MGNSMMNKCTSIIKKNHQIVDIIKEKYLVHDLNPTCNSNNPNFTIIFFHGIVFGTNDAWKETWTTRPTNDREECICWPEKWLPEDLNNNVRILSLSYDSHIVASVHDDVTEIGKNLIQSLIANSSYQSLWDGPVTLVAYSFGGLVLKSLVVEAHKRLYQRLTNRLDDKIQKCCKTFLNNVKGVIFYGVPHSGATNLSKYFKWQCQQINTSNKHFAQLGFARNLEPFNQQMESLSKEFKDIVHDLIIYEFGEGLPVDKNWEILVPYVSATQLSNNHYKIEDADHLTICKPPNKAHPSYSLLLQCLRICMQEEEISKLPKPMEASLVTQVDNLQQSIESHEKNILNMPKTMEVSSITQMQNFHFVEPHKEDNQGTDTVRGLLIAGAKDGAAWKAETYTRMSELHFLILDHCQVKGDFSTWSEELRRLQWWSLPLSELPPTRGLLNLSVMDLTSSRTVTRISPKNSNDEFLCKELRMLILKDCTALEELPQTIGKLSRLKNLDVRGCSTLKALPDSVGELVELTQLNLSNCTTLERLPDTICLLSKLEKLWLINCTKLESLPEEFGKLQRLDEFWADATSLSKLPHSFSKLSNLEDLHLHKCEKIQELPSMSGLVKLKLFHMGHIGVQTLPEDFGHLQNLVNLHLYECKNLQTLPQSFGFLRLQTLEMNDNPKLEMLPEGFGRFLFNLSVLDLTGSKSLTRISPKNSNDEFLCKELQMLILKDCTALEELPQTIGKLSRLKNLDVRGCSTLKALPDSVGELVELTQLNLSNCTTLERLPDTICLLSKLEKLWLINCTKLESLPEEFGKLQRLDEFWADATSLSKLPHSFSKLSNLEDLHLHKCEKIQELPSMSGLVKLKLFHMGHIGVQTLPEDFGHLQNLVNLHLYECKNLQTLPQSFGFLRLQTLEMNDNPKLEMLPEGFGRFLFNLSVLDLTGSKSLTRISPKNSNDEFLCKELQMLILKDCTALEELPQTIGKLSRLKNLDVRGCSTLKALPDSVGELVELTQLNLSNCTTLERLPDTICLLSKLEKLWLINCTKLKSLPEEFGKLQRLDEFWADATSLSKLPHSFSKLSNLEDLHLHKCEKIQELPSMSGLVKLKLFHMGHIGVQTLPEDFGHLQNLVNLHLYECKNLQTLPQSFGFLRLQTLEMNDNPKLEMLPEGFGRFLFNLSVLDLTGSKSLTRISPKNSNDEFLCKELQMLILKDCAALEELPQTIGKLSRLRNLDVQGCSTLKALPDSVGELMELRQLNLSNCTTLERLPDTICLLSKLEKLWLINCTKLKSLPEEFGKLQRLDEFWADATSLSKLPHSFSKLSNLEDLHLHKCEKIQELPSMSGLVKLKLFHMGHIGVQTLPEDFGHLQNLVELHLYECKNLQTLPQSFGFLQLQRLRMNDNPKLEMLSEGFGRLKSLVDLHIGNNSIQ